jgi:hypothetical protein
MKITHRFIGGKIDPVRRSPARDDCNRNKRRLSAVPPGLPFDDLALPTDGSAGSLQISLTG